eukprot:365124-Chlamydomonas_euryale.AAC.21
MSFHSYDLLKQPTFHKPIATEAQSCNGLQADGINHHGDNGGGIAAVAKVADPSVRRAFTAEPPSAAPP